MLLVFVLNSMRNLSHSNECCVMSIACMCAVAFSSVQFSGSVVSDSLRPHESQHARPPCPSPTPGVDSDSRPSSQWCHPAISCEELTHWKRLWCWEGLGAGGEGDDRGWDGWMASLTRWTWVWVNSGGWWWTGRPGVLRFMELQRVRHDWATDLIWSER